MSEYRLSRKAVADLSSIWDYTVDQWGVAQAQRYLEVIHLACEKLAHGQISGQDASAIRPGYRRLPVQSHVLYFRVSRDRPILIVRILHQRMDAMSRF